MKIAIIGLGLTGARLFRELLKQDIYEPDLIGVDIDESRVHMIQNEFPRALVTTSISRARDESPKLWVIATNEKCTPHVIQDLLDRGEDSLISLRSNFSLIDLERIQEKTKHSERMMHVATATNFSSMLMRVREIMAQENLVVTQGSITWWNTCTEPGCCAHTDVWNGVSAALMLSNINQRVASVDVAGMRSYAENASSCSTRPCELYPAVPPMYEVGLSALMLACTDRNICLPWTVTALPSGGHSAHRITVLLTHEGTSSTPTHALECTFGVPIEGERLDQLAITHFASEKRDVEWFAADCRMPEVRAILDFMRHAAIDPCFTDLTALRTIAGVREGLTESSGRAGKMVRAHPMVVAPRLLEAHA